MGCLNITLSEVEQRIVFSLILQMTGWGVWRKNAVGNNEGIGGNRRHTTYWSFLHFSSPHITSHNTKPVWIWGRKYHLDSWNFSSLSLDFCCALINQSFESSEAGNSSCNSHAVSIWGPVVTVHQHDLWQALCCLAIYSKQKGIWQLLGVTGSRIISCQNVLYGHTLWQRKGRWGGLRWFLWQGIRQSSTRHCCLLPKPAAPHWERQLGCSGRKEVRFQVSDWATDPKKLCRYVSPCPSSQDFTIGLMSSLRFQRAKAFMSK